ncbi:MAG: hypothetical protein WB696_23250 [Chthoniobacterales bacterium]
MDTSNSPGWAERRDATRRLGENKRPDTELLPDRSFLGNCRRKIRVEGGATLYEVFVINSYFELVTDCGTERFDEQWQGIVQQVRLAERNQSHGF